MPPSLTLFESSRTRARTPSRGRRRTVPARQAAPSLLTEPAALREAQVAPAPAPAAQPPHAHELPDKSGGLTLDDLVVGVWEGLSAHRTVPCPACGGAMAPRYGSGPGPVGGRCGGCATTIA